MNLLSFLFMYSKYPLAMDPRKTKTHLDSLSKRRWTISCVREDHSSQSWDSGFHASTVGIAFHRRTPCSAQVSNEPVFEEGMWRSVHNSLLRIFQVAGAFLRS